MDDSRELALIEGIVQAVIYQNEENGYTVLKLDAGETQGGITVVGCMPGAAPGEGLSVRGAWMHHASYGDQFKAEQVERRLPAGERAVFDYLASGAVRGIGAATAKSMINAFGAEALAVLEDTPERLTEIKGITKKRALTMGNNFREQMGMRRLLEFLQAHALPLQLAMPLFRRYGDRSLEVLKANPYLLVDGDLGVDFSLADDMAISLGLEGDDP
ncbi:MAG: ATP-dependent RecD-like DNA helicase, partial [Pseudoflavonifractor sp.]